MGEQEASYAYGSFGERESDVRDQKFMMSTYGYTGREHDEESGLNYYRNRYVHADSARFVSRDPIGHIFGPNLFAYVLNNSTNWIDPWGLYWEYSQSTGKLYYFNEKTKVRSYVAAGYAGSPSGAGLNNPSMENEPNVGPIPRGTYVIGSPRNSPSTGKFVMDLYQNVTLISGRSAFQIHGDTSCGCQRASQGCIVLGLSTREQIAFSGDNILKVTP